MWLCSSGIGTMFKTFWGGVVAFCTTALLVLTASGAATAQGFDGLEQLDPPVMRPADVDMRDNEGVLIALEGAPVTVLNFWATWCAPCVAELPTLLALDAALEDRGLRVVAASLDRSHAQIESFWQQQGWGDGLEIGLDEKGALFRAFGQADLGARGVPYTAILNADGAVISWFAGETDWASAAVLGYFDSVLSGAGR